jgi:nucleoside-diphosphate-sugar epimerase
MAPRVFITGVSGYIGGQLLANISFKHPNYEIVGLVRDIEQGERIKAKYPLLQTVYGDLDSSDLLAFEAGRADVVFQTANSDHNLSVVSILRGLSQRHRKGALIQLSGAASIGDVLNGYGQPSTKIWNDIDDIQKIATLDHTHIHASTDQLVIQEGKIKGVRTAIVLPPMVYGTGMGPIKTTSMQLPWLVEAINKRGKAFTIMGGNHYVSAVHVINLANALVLLAEQALDPTGGKAQWGNEGMYYVEAGSYVFADIVAAVAKKMQEKALIKTADVDRLSIEDGTRIHPWAPIMWGTNLRVSGSRLRLLGWTPEGPDVLGTISEYLS